MRLFALLAEPAAVRAILAYLGEPTSSPLLAPSARDPLPATTGARSGNAHSTSRKRPFGSSIRRGRGPSWERPGARSSSDESHLDRPQQAIAGMDGVVRSTGDGPHRPATQRDAGVGGVVGNGVQHLAWRPGRALNVMALMSAHRACSKSASRGRGQPARAGHA